MSVGYGVEVWCTTAIVSDRLARGRDVVLQALIGRLTTAKGTLRGGDEESDYGFDVSDYIGAVGYAVAEMTLPTQVANELRKDDRVAEVLVRASIVNENGVISIVLSIDVTLSGESQSFPLTLSATDAETLPLNMDQAA